MTNKTIRTYTPGSDYFEVQPQPRLVISCQAYRNSTSISLAIQNSEYTEKEMMMQFHVIVFLRQTAMKQDLIRNGAIGKQDGSLFKPNWRETDLGQRRSMQANLSLILFNQSGFFKGGLTWKERTLNKQKKLSLRFKKREYLMYFPNDYLL
ncbi:hypothetical protein RCL_jg28435.t2 [Rhizophagus clarus]|uniref:Uncharacterized protein n=1 Tax=Rhizophagus clarus TaxID=94130 RepID=A0A8H3M4E4_9GLOM|nr:hypothetical protein RCL_jg28435.t2 [Rhizophagus clarus]